MLCSIAGDVLKIETLEAVPRVPYGVVSSRHGKGALALTACSAVISDDERSGSGAAPEGAGPATTEAAFDPDEVDVTINGVTVCRAGGVGEDRSLVDLTPRRVEIRIHLHAGDATATIRTTDLTHDYVHENSAYST